MDKRLLIASPMDPTFCMPNNLKKWINFGYVNILSHQEKCFRLLQMKKSSTLESNTMLWLLLCLEKINTNGMNL